MSERRILHKLKYHRSKRGFTQKEMAKMLNMSHSNYVHIENGRTSVSFETILNIRKVLNEKGEELGLPKLTIDDIFCD